MKVVITGAGRGIGYALAKEFAKNTDNQVFTISRNTGKLEQLASELKLNHLVANFNFISYDLLSDDYSDLIKSIQKQLGEIDILINNAGMLLNKPFEEILDADFDSVFNMNVKSPFRLIRDLLPLFNKQAHIVNISSMGGIQGSVKFPGLSLYSASKGALAVLTECLAEELKDKEIKVNALAIGAVQTEMLAEAFPGYKAPLQPGEMASFITNFALTGHQYFNGKILQVSLSTP